MKTWSTIRDIYSRLKPMNKKQKKVSGKRERIISSIFIVVLLLVAVWMIAANRAQSSFGGYDITPEKFAKFSPSLTGWDARNIPAKFTKYSPNLVAYEMCPRLSQESKVGGGRIVSRLANGYNMVDCMTVKGYKVDLLSNMLNGDGKTGKVYVQTWLLTRDGIKSVLATSLLRSSDLTTTSADVRSMVYPYAGKPGDQNLGMHGFSWRHPFVFARNAVRSRWVNSQRDVLAFLRLKKRRWADDKVLTMVTEFSHQPTPVPSTETMEKMILNVHYAMATEFHKFADSEPMDQGL